MARVLCTLPNASTVINGVNFSLDRGQMLSDDMDAATAADFASIAGYKLVLEKKPANQTVVAGTITAAPAVAEAVETGK